MKNLFTLIFSILSLNLLNAQNTSLTMGSGYTNQIFYSMENGETANINNEDWDIAFSTDAFSSTIRINDGKGVELYTYPLGDTTDWNLISSSIISSINAPLFNSDTDWSIGAFDLNTIGGGLDYGWGVYSMVSHDIVGDSLFILKTISGEWKKLWMEKKDAGEYFFRYANLDGSNLVSTSVAASNYGNKNFVYYSLDNEQVLDREPDSNNWDITFTKYITPVQSQPYSVTGVFHNNGIEIAEASNISSPLTYIDYNAHTFETEINTIGYDWKSFSGMSYVVDPNRCYFVRVANGDIYRIVFTFFDGMSTGNIEFNTQLLSATNIIENNSVKNFVLYPNPTSSNTTLIYDVDNSLTHLAIYDISGREVYSSDVFSNRLYSLELPTSNFESGTYIISLYNKYGSLYKEKLIVY